MAVTQRMLAETVSELCKVARDLREAADEEPLPETKGKVVPASVRGLRSYADFLDRVGRELMELIDGDTPVEVEAD
jgi:hypothetical protein